MTWEKDVPPEERKFYNVTRWRPDTCGCILEFAWDTRTSEEDRNHLPAEIVHACPAHAEFVHKAKGKDVAGHFNEILAENQHKNITLAGVLEDLGDEYVDIVKDEQGGQHRQFKHAPRWSYNDKRELVIELDGVVPAKHRTELAAKIKKHSGARKVHLK